MRTWRQRMCQHRCRAPAERETRHDNASLPTWQVQLEKMGYNMGVRMVDELLAKVAARPARGSLVMVASPTELRPPPRPRRRWRSAPPFPRRPKWWPRSASRCSLASTWRRRPPARSLPRAAAPPPLRPRQVAAATSSEFRLLLSENPLAECRGAVASPPSGAASQPGVPRVGSSSCQRSTPSSSTPACSAACCAARSRWLAALACRHVGCMWPSAAATPPPVSGATQPRLPPLSDSPDPASAPRGGRFRCESSALCCETRCGATRRRRGRRMC